MTASSFLSRVAKSQYIQFFVLSVGIVLAIFLWEGHQGFDLWDEGFLWYGVQRTLQGEVPIRDFMAYDPGRYYWSAAFMKMWGGDGILAVRGAAAVFQVFGLFIGLIALSSAHRKQPFIFWVLSAISLAAWMSPLYKLFDVVLSISLVAGVAFLIKQPTSGRYFFLGLLVGLVAVFGRNHGLYGAIASFGCIVYGNIRCVNRLGIPRSLAAWVAGVFVGYMPVIIMSIATPGFALALWESIRFLFEAKVTNLSLPIPWPWTVKYESLPFFDVFRGWLGGLFFVALLAFGGGAIGWVILQRIKKKEVSPLLVSSAFLSLPYAHYAYSRSDTLHLAMGVIPFVIGSYAVLMNQRPVIKWLLAVMLCAGNLMVMAPLHPGWVCYSSRQCVEADVRGDKLITHPNVPIELAVLKSLAETYAKNNESAYVAPFWPGAYSVLNRKSPVWEIYALFPRDESFQRLEIERIVSAKIGFALILNIPLDGREQLRFENSHNLIDRYIKENFDQVHGKTHDPAFQLYVRKGEGV